MKKIYALLLGLVPLGISPVGASLANAAVEPENFHIRSAADLAALCRVASDDPYAQQAVHFCHGYVAGAYHYYLKSTGGSAGSGFVCVPDPAPSRNDAIAAFVAWLDAHPAQQNEDAVDALFFWAASQYPCS